MKSNAVLLEAFGRLKGIVHGAVRDLSSEELHRRLAPEANSIAWLVWHLTRIQDDHIAGVAGTEQVWISEGWEERFGLPFEPSAIGYGHSSQEVAQVRVESADLLTGYYDATDARTMAFLDDLGEDDLDRVVDDRWDPPVTMCVRLVSVLCDNLEHAGQAQFIRGIVHSG
ncbi:MAG TPA: DUF664 domain-containing protein [Chloroflexota bacterium]|nr:DUF664 domain-containing protein [Chloroflexota bacterium]